MALWFASSFGLQLKSLTVEENDTGKVHDLKCHQHVPNLEPTTSTDQSGETSTFSSLPLEEKNMVEQILFLLDKFCVGDNFYHELSMIVNGLPRSYLVKQCRHDLKANFLEQKSVQSKTYLLLIFWIISAKTLVFKLTLTQFKLKSVVMEQK